MILKIIDEGHNHDFFFLKRMSGTIRKLKT